MEKAINISSGVRNKVGVFTMGWFLFDLVKRIKTIEPIKGFHIGIRFKLLDHIDRRG